MGYLKDIETAASKVKKTDSINSIIDMHAPKAAKKTKGGDLAQQAHKQGFRAGFGAKLHNDDMIKPEHREHYKKGYDSGKAARKKVGEKNIPPTHVAGRFGTKKPNPQFNKVADEHHAKETAAAGETASGTDIKEKVATKFDSYSLSVQYNIKVAVQSDLDLDVMSIKTGKQFADMIFGEGIRENRKLAINILIRNKLVTNADLRLWSAAGEQ